MLAFTEHSASAGAEPSSGASGDRPVLPVWSTGWELALQEATTPAQILELNLSPVSPLLPGARISAIGDWTALARLGAAFRAGRGARFKLRGDTGRVYPPLTPPLRLNHFVVLRCPKHPQGFWTTNGQTYFREVGDTFGRGNLPPGTVCFSAASRAEVTAFLLGAEAQWPAQLP